jgi:outer membrane protein assembly factor BamB
MKRFLPAVLLLLSSPALQAAAAAGSWPLFRGDPRLSGVAGEALPVPLEPRWTFQAGDGVESTAAIVDGTVYVGSLDGFLWALDLATGEPRWKYEAADEIKSSPSVHAGTVYFGDESGAFHAVEAATGEVRWVFEAGAGVISSANFAGDCVLFGSQDNFIYCVKPSDGSLRWKVETGSYVYATPALATVNGKTAALSAGCDGLLRAVSVADGSELSTIEMGAYVGASPAVGGGRVFVGTFDNQFLALDLAREEVVWRYEHPERQFPYYSSAAVTDEIVVVGGRDKMVHALDPATGREIWSVAAGDRVDGSPVISGGRVFVGTLGGDLYALDLATGEKVWEFATGSGLMASPAVAEESLVIGTLDGLLYCFAAEVGGDG